MGTRHLNSVVVISGLGSMTLACMGATLDPPCPETIQSGTACIAEQQTCSHDVSSDPCDTRIHTCTNGVWEPVVYPCNPPMPDTDATNTPPPEPQPVKTDAIEMEPIEAEPPHDAAACPDTIVVGEVCVVESQRCMIPGKENSCGIQGHECRDGTWRRIARFCNPPR